MAIIALLLGDGSLGNYTVSAEARSIDIDLIILIAFLITITLVLVLFLRVQFVLLLLGSTLFFTDFFMLRHVRLLLVPLVFLFVSVLELLLNMLFVDGCYIGSHWAKGF